MSRPDTKKSVDLDAIARRVAGVQSPAQKSSSGQLRTAGTIEFIRDQGPVRRDIRAPGFEWSPDSMRDLAKILWQAQRAHSYGMSAYRLFSKLPSAQFSPDGLLGGRGYIQSVKDLRTALGSAVETFSAFTDTVHDEINAPHWAPVVDQDAAAASLIEDAAQIKANPDGFVEGEMKEEIANPDSDSMNPSVEGEEGQGDEEEEEEESDPRLSSKVPVKKKGPASGLPEDKSEQKEGRSESELEMHTVTPDHGSYASSIQRILSSHRKRYAKSDMGDIQKVDSLPEGTTPRPVVDHIGPAAGNEAGHFNNDEVWPSDDPSGEGFYSKEPLYDSLDSMGGGSEGMVASNIGDISARVAATYSWLPGANNQKMMNYYDPDATPEDIAWMAANSDPDPPPGTYVKKARTTPDPLWEGI